MSPKTKWGVSQGTIDFLSKALEGHARVESYQMEHEIFFRIARGNGLPNVNALLINVYTAGLADYFAARAEFPDLNCLIVGGNWNAYTKEAKEQALSDHVGLFAFGEFLGALNIADFHSFAKKDKDGNSIYQFRAA